MRRRFVTLDVFTDQRLAGNPLAVVIEADGLEQPQMQAVAREFNLPETVFLLPPGDTENRARLRIFTPKAELPFAGHPTVGTAVLLGCMSSLGGGTRDFTLEEPIGLVRCRVERQGRDRGRAQFIVPRLPERAGPAGDKAALATALRLEPDDIGFSNFSPARWSAGLTFTFVPLRGLDAIRRAAPDPARFESAFGGKEFGKAYMFSGETEDPKNHFHVRMFAPGLGVPEDPATGSAAAAFAGLLAAGRPDGEHRVRVEQGHEMSRPSLIEIDFTIRSRALVEVVIGGSAVMLSEGTIEV